MGSYEHRVQKFQPTQTAREPGPTSRRSARCSAFPLLPCSLSFNQSDKMRQAHGSVEGDALYHNGKMGGGQIRTNKMSWMSSDQRGRGDMRDSWQWGPTGPRVILTAAPAQKEFGRAKGVTLPAAGTRSVSPNAMLQSSYSGELGESGRLKPVSRYPTSAYVRAHCSQVVSFFIFISEAPRLRSDPACTGFRRQTRLVYNASHPCL